MSYDALFTYAEPAAVAILMALIVVPVIIYLFTGWSVRRSEIVGAMSAEGASLYFRLPPGRYRFSASADGYGSQTIAAEVPSSDLRIPLPRGSRLLLQSHGNARRTARLIQADGDEYVRCWGNAVAEIRIDSRTTVVEPVATGSYMLEIRQTGAKPRTIPISVGEGETVTVPIDP